MQMLSLWVIVILFALSTADTINSGPAKYPFQDASLPWEKRVDDLVSRLTLDELVNQSLALYNDAPSSISRLGIAPYQWISECLHGYVDRNATAFPEALGLAATFSRNVIFNMATAVSNEVRAYYNNDIKKGVFGRSGLSCFSPVINIMRHPLWGRSQESYGEDPYLTSELVKEYVKGLQGDHPRYVRANAGCKHFAAYAGPENIPVSRFEFDAKVSERDLRMTFLPQFEACVKAGTYNIMCSYNSVNGIPSCVNKRLLTDILRKEWGFKGYVISDSIALSVVVKGHKYVKTYAECAADAVNAGCNLELSGAPHNDVVFAQIPKAIDQGLLSKATFVESMKPMFYTRMRLGEFDPPQMNPYSSIEMSEVLSPAHIEAASQAASMSFVLLKNIKGYLPIKKKFSRLAIVGPMADNAKEIFGGYSPNPSHEFIVTPLKGLGALGTTVAHASGCSDTKCMTYSHDDIKQAVHGSTFVIVCLGTGTDVESEGNDRTELDLPGKQLQLLKDAIFYSREAPLLLLLFTAGPVDLTFAQESPEVDAIIQCFYPGQTTGLALYNTLTASSPHTIPAGRLPSTWPAQLHQYPPITDYNMTDHQTYRYAVEEPLYPFGYGLSYSKFHYSSLKISPERIKRGENVTVSVSVLNRGPYDADEVVQVYLSWTKASVPVPRWTLVGFERPALVVNKARMLTFTIASSQMAVWTDNNGFVR